MRDFVGENYLKFHTHRKQFKILFDEELIDFFNLATGFDIVRFDDVVVRSHDRVSVQQALCKEYGAEAVMLIKKLL